MVDGPVSHLVDVDVTGTHRIHVTGIFTYIWLKFMVNVGKYTIHGSYGGCLVGT